MSLFTTASIIVSLCALLAWVNTRTLKLPTTIGVMAIALVLSLILLALPKFGLPIEDWALAFVGRIDFNTALLEGMLGFLLFAGALHVNLDDLKEQKFIVGSLAVAGTLVSTALVAATTYYLLGWMGVEVPWIFALLFGALISPTDPIAVMAILKKAGIAKSLETKVVGESLFNDGIGVVVFLVLLGVATGGEATAGEIGLLFVQEAVGGALLGLGLGWLAFRLLASVDSYQVEILLTLAVVMGGYSLAGALHLSGPIAMVVAGLMIGNHSRVHAMSATTREHVDTFWQLIDELLNVLLFVLIGLEVLVVPFSMTAFQAGLIAIPLVLLVRMIAVGGSVTLLRLHRDFSPHVVKILTWGGLRGGISVALALALPAGPERDILLVMTYCVVIFSILVQGLTIGRVVRRLNS